MRFVSVSISVLVFSCLCGSQSKSETVNKQKKSNLENNAFLIPANGGVDNDPWGGAYFGASLGAGWGASTQVYNRAGEHGPATLDTSGTGASVNVGEDWHFNTNVIYGWQGDFGVMNISKGATTVFDGHVWSSDVGSPFATFRGRVGYELTDQTLLYGSAGLGIAYIDDTSIGNTIPESAQAKGFRAGWVLGVGAEYALNQNWNLRAEYLHMDFGKVEGMSANNEDFSFSNSVNLLQIGMNTNF